MEEAKDKSVEMTEEEILAQIAANEQEVQNHVDETSEEIGD